MEGSNFAKWRAMSITFTVPSTGLWKNTGRILCSMGISNASSGQIFFDDFEFFEEK
jgi:hypothetical protein